MTEKEYIDHSDLITVRDALNILASANLFNDPNKTRYLSVVENLRLIREDLSSKVCIED